MAETSASASFCIGGAMIMGGNGLSLAGAGGSRDGDCLMLWTEAFTVNSVERAVMANVGVFLLALLAQFLTSINANRMQRAKQFAKRKRALSALGGGDATTGYASASEWRRHDTNAPVVNGSSDTPSEAIPLVSHWEHLGDSLQHGYRILIAYLLMLAAMTYDIGLISSTVAGFMVGYFFFTKDTTKVPASADPCCS